MAYQALYRKWRPLTFSDVTGQQHIVDTLRNEILSGRIAHAYLFCGTRGTGKTSLAKIFARAVNCTDLQPGADPCNRCETCRGILDGTILDINEIDAASNNGVDSIRDIRSEVIYQPANAKYRVYIIDEVHMLSTAAFNALLKTLEEPPAHVIFILATTESHKIPATIRSRCQRFDFRRISRQDIAGRISKIAQSDNINITDDAISKIAYLADGSMRDALSILEQCTPLGEITLDGVEQIVGIANDITLLSIAENIRKGNIDAVMSAVDSLLAEGKEVLRLMESVLDLMRDLLVCKSAKNPGDVLEMWGERLDRCVEVSKSFTAEELMYCIRIFTDAITGARLSSKPKILLETSLIRACKPELSVENDALLARIAKLEQNGIAVQKPVDVSASASDKSDEKAVYEDNIPMPGDDDVPMPSEEDIPPVLGEDLPPWEENISSQDVMPISDKKTVSEKNVSDEENVDCEQTSDKSSNLSADQMLDKIKLDDPAIRPSLIGAKAKISGGELVICQTKSFTFGMLQRSLEIMEKSVGISIKVVNTQEEFDGFESAPADDGADKFEELLAQKEIFGDKMIIE